MAIIEGTGSTAATLQSFVGERRVTGPENAVGAKLHIELALERRPHVDLGDDAKARGLEVTQRAASPNPSGSAFPR
jgi:hypothetical protein